MRVHIVVYSYSSSIVLPTVLSVHCLKVVSTQQVVQPYSGLQEIFLRSFLENSCTFSRCAFSRINFNDFLFGSRVILMVIVLSIYYSSCAV